MMAELLLSGRAIDGILGLVVLEAAALLAYRAARGRGPPSSSFLANLLSGAFLLIALRDALAGGSALVIGGCLTAALIAHVYDLYGRWDSVPVAERPVTPPATVPLRVPDISKPPAPRAPNKESSDA